MSNVQRCDYDEGILHPFSNGKWAVMPWSYHEKREAEIERLRQQLKEAQDPAADGPLQSLIATLREALEERELKIVYQDRRICKFEDALARVKEWVDDEGWCPICDEHTCRKGNCVLAEIGGEDE